MNEFLGFFLDSCGFRTFFRLHNEIWKVNVKASLSSIYMHLHANWRIDVQKQKNCLALSHGRVTVI